MFHLPLIFIITLYWSVIEPKECGKNRLLYSNVGWEMILGSFVERSTFLMELDHEHICRHLMVGPNEKYKSLNHFKQTTLGRRICKERCQLGLSIPIVNLKCAPRRGPPLWKSSAWGTEDVETKFNCSDLGLDLTPEEALFPTDIYMKFIALYPEEMIPFGMFTYLEKLNLESVKLAWFSGSEGLGVENHYPYLFETVRAFKNAKQLHLNGHYSFKDKLAKNINQALFEFEKLEGLTIEFIDIENQLPFIRNKHRLVFFKLGRVNLSKFPKGLAELTNLRYLQIRKNYEVDLAAADAKILDSFKFMEYFIVQNTKTEQIGSKFLAESRDLVFLDLSCNRIKTVAEDAFSHMTKLQVLNLNGNILATIAPKTFHGLNNLKMLELRNMEVKTYSDGGQSVRYHEYSSTLTTRVFCDLKENVNLGELDVLSHLDKDQFKDLEKLERLELANHPRLKIEPDTLEPLKGSLKYLELARTGPQDMAELQLQKFCNLETLILNNKPIENQDWLSYDLVVNLQRLNQVSFNNISLEKVTGPLCLLSEFAGEYARALLYKAVDKNPTKTEQCGKSLWDAIQTNQPKKLDSVCLNEYKQIKQDLVLWQSRSTDPVYVSCPIYGSAIGQHQQLYVTLLVVLMCAIFV